MSRKGKALVTRNYGKMLESCESLKNKRVYFLDLSALVFYSGPLYGGFVANDEFNYKVIVPDEDSVFITDEKTIEGLRKLEEKHKKKIYSGYTDFIAKNVFAVYDKNAIEAIVGENILRRAFSETEIIEDTEPYTSVLGALYFLYHKNFDPVLLTTEEKLKKMALDRSFKVLDIR